MFADLYEQLLSRQSMSKSAVRAMYHSVEAATGQLVQHIPCVVINWVRNFTEGMLRFGDSYCAMCT